MFLLQVVPHNSAGGSVLLSICIMHIISLLFDNLLGNDADK